MVVTVNGTRTELPDGATVGRLLEGYSPEHPGGRGVAVAVEGEVVPRAAWPRTEIADGARVEVVVAVQGG